MNKKLLAAIIILIGVMIIGYFVYYTIPTDSPDMPTEENTELTDENNTADNNTDETENNSQNENTVNTDDADIETNQATSTPNTETVEPTDSRDNRTVTFTNSGFTPEILEIKVGQSVYFKNESSSLMWVASDNHPTHEILPEFDQGTAVSNGGEYTFRFDETGEWGYHNHLRSQETGTIIVIE